MWLGRKRLWLERGRKGRGEGENKGEAMKKVLGLERKGCDFGKNRCGMDKRSMQWNFS